MKARNRILIPGVVVAAIILVAVIFYARKPSAVQPINFSHEIHTSMVECDTCHQYYMERKVAGRPTVEICTSCHSEAETSEQEKILSYAERGEEIPWQRVFKLPDHVYFSHMRHVAVGNIKCAACHGQVEKMGVPLVKPLVKIKMDFCIDCHKKLQITRDCNACHM
jgi:hypothetical protein